MYEVISSFQVRRLKLNGFFAIDKYKDGGVFPHPFFLKLIIAKK